MTIPLTLSVISLCLCVLGFFLFRRYIDRKTAARELLADYRTEVNNLIAGIDAATDRDSLLVEERIKALKGILEDTDRRISVYIRELQRSKEGEAMYASLGRGIRAALDSRPPQPEPPPGNDEPSPLPQVQADEHSAKPQPETRRGSKNAKSAHKKTRIRAHIAELSAQGLSPQEIASRLELSFAEVDLALNLLTGPGRSSEE